MSRIFQNMEGTDIAPNNLQVNKEEANGEFQKSDGNTHNFVIGPDNLKRWYNLKRYFSCNSNEEFVSKLLDIAHEYILSESSTSSPVINEAINDITTEKRNNLNEIHEDFEVKNYSKDQELVPSTSLLDNLPVKNYNKQHKKKQLSRLSRHGVCKISSYGLNNENVDKKPSIICRYCDNKHNYSQCSSNNPVERIADSVNIDTWTENCKDEEEHHRVAFARISLPSCLIFLDTRNVGIATKISIKPFTEFGPLIGKRIKEVDIHDDCNMKHIWELQLDTGNIYINTEDHHNSNWMRFIRPAPTREERNLTVIIKDHYLYLVSIKSLSVGDELLYWQDTFLLNSRNRFEKTVCGGCNMTFDHPLYYRVHCSLFHDLKYSLTIRKYHCKICGAAILGKENIRRHATELHNGKGAYQCQYCDKFFLRLSYLEMHRTYGCSSNPLRSKSLCDFCGRKFCQPQKLKIHIKRMHSNITDVLKDFQCKKCMKVLGSRAALQRHTKEVHEKQVDDTYSCKICGKHFQNKSNLKIHMLTHSGIKPFRCKIEVCSAAFTTKQCLQLHYKKIHNFDEKNMPEIERSISYTFQAYSGGEKIGNQMIDSPGNNSGNEDSSNKAMEKCEEDNLEEEDSDIFDATELHSPDDMPKDSPVRNTQLSPTHILESVNHETKESPTLKMMSKGSKKWIADEISNHSVKGLDSFALETRNQSNKNMEDLNLRKYSSICEFTRREPSNASLLVEAALDSVCNEPSIDIDVEVTHNCTETLENNIYSLSQSSGLPDVAYNLQESQDINLISPSVNDHISVTDELDGDIKGNQNIEINYSNLQDGHFRPESQDSPSSMSRDRNLSSMFRRSHKESENNYSAAQGSRRYDFVENINAEHLSSDDSNGIVVDNPSLNDVKHIDSELNLSMHKKSTYKMYDYFKRLKFDENGSPHENDNHPPETEVPDIASHLGGKEDTDKYNHELAAADMRSKFEIDFDIRVRHYENNLDVELNRHRTSYDICTNDLNARSKNADLLNMTSDNRDLADMDFRSEKHFEPLALNSSDLQGLDMSTRSFHNYTSNINRYHHLYPDIDRMDLRLNYTPPPPYDLVRVVSLDLTPPGRHSVDLSLRSIPLHQITNSRLLTEHSLSNKHRSFDQARLLAGELISRINENRIIPDGSSERILGSVPGAEQSSLLADESRLLPDHPRLIDQRSLLGDAHLLSSASVAASPSMPAFGSYAGVSQSAYHTAPIDPRTHMTSPANAGYHHPYSTYYP